MLYWLRQQDERETRDVTLVSPASSVDTLTAVLLVCVHSFLPHNNRILQIYILMTGCCVLL